MIKFALNGGVWLTGVRTRLFPYLWIQLVCHDSQKAEHADLIGPISQLSLLVILTRSISTCASVVFYVKSTDTQRKAEVCQFGSGPEKDGIYGGTENAVRWQRAVRGERVDDGGRGEELEEERGEKFRMEK